MMRAEKVAARKAQRTDQTYCGTAPGTVGPVEARLRTFDKTVPLVFGAFGEASAAVEQLIDALAEAGADVHWCSSVQSESPLPALAKGAGTR